MNGNNPDWNKRQRDYEKRREKYEQGWCDFMVEIWHDRLMQLNIKDTGALIESVKGELAAGSVSVITHKFLMYGIYVAAGTGNGYRHGNSGKDDDDGLQFLRGDKWKEGKHRVPRDWFSRKYLASIHKLNETEAEILGTSYNGILITALDQLFEKESVLRSL